MALGPLKGGGGGDPSTPGFFVARENAILDMLAQGHSKSEIAAALGISAFAVSDHLRHALHKLGVDSPPAAVAKAIELGIIEGPPVTWPLSTPDAPSPVLATKASTEAEGAVRMVKLLVAADKDAFLKTHREEAMKSARREEARRIAKALSDQPFADPLAVANEFMSAEARMAAGLPLYTKTGLKALHQEHPTILPDPTVYTNGTEAAEVAAINVIKRVLYADRGLPLSDLLGIEILRRGSTFLSPLVNPWSLPDLINGPLRATSEKLIDLTLEAVPHDPIEPTGLLDRSWLKSLLEHHPEATGLSSAIDRQKRVLSIVAEALGDASPKTNLYEVLEGAARRITETLKHPSVSAIDPSTLLDLVALDPRVDLGHLVGPRADGISRGRALELVRVVGRLNLDKMSMSEIVRTASSTDSIYTSELVQRLFVEHPDVFGIKEPPPEKRAYLLAYQIADLMGRMDTGATLDEVASFLRQRSPSFAEAYPGFSAADVRLLRATFDFIPQWEVKPETPTPVARSSRMSIDKVLGLCTSLLSNEKATGLQEAIFGVLDEGLKTGKIPQRLEAAVSEAFQSAALRYGLMRCFWPKQSYPTDHKMLDAAIRALNGREHDLDGAKARLASLGVPQRTVQIAADVATCADRMDHEGMFAALCRIPGIGATYKLKEGVDDHLRMLSLSRETLLSRVESDVFRNNELRAAFQRMSRIPLRLPMVQEVVKRYQDRQPFKDTNVLMVQHMLGQTYPQISGYQQLGMDPKKCILVGIPYHPNPEVESAIAGSFGVEARIPPRNIEALKAEIHRGVDDLVKRYRENGQDCLIVCDGPEARTYFMKTYADKEPELLQHFRFTEQTAFGDRPEYRAMKLRCVSYARTRLKAKEARFVGQSIVRAFQAQLHKLGTGYEEKLVLIRGLGSIGWATADAFAGDRAHVAVYDPMIDPKSEQYDAEKAPALIAEARAKGFRVFTDRVEAANAGAFLQVGCSGYLSMGELELKAAKSGSFAGSGSSKQVELAMKTAAELSTDEHGRVHKVRVSEVNEQETWAYCMNDGRIVYIVADGFPVNFNDMNVVPPEFIDMTMSLSLAAAAQAMSGDELRFEDLNQKDHDLLDNYFESYLDKLERGEITRSY